MPDPPPVPGLRPDQRPSAPPTLSMSGKNSAASAESTSVHRAMLRAGERRAPRSGLPTCAPGDDGNGWRREPPVPAPRLLASAFHLRGAWLGEDSLFLRSQLTSSCSLRGSAQPKVFGPAVRPGTCGGAGTGGPRLQPFPSSPGGRSWRLLRLSRLRTRLGRDPRPASEPGCVDPAACRRVIGRVGGPYVTTGSHRSRIRPHFGEGGSRLLLRLPRRREPPSLAPAPGP